MTVSLLVEDERPVARDLPGALRRLGFENLLVTASAPAAIEAAAERSPGLVVVNVEVSDEALSLLSAHVDAPVVYVSASAERETFRPFACLAAPFSDRELEDAIDLATLRRRRAADSRVEEQLAIADRMTSLGTMAAGIAHEINNPVAFLVSNIDYTSNQLRSLAIELETLVTRLGGSTPDRKAGMLLTIEDMSNSMADAREGAERVRGIAADLRSFSHPDPHFRPVDVRPPIELALRICDVKSNRRAILRSAFGAAPRIMANEGRLAQILVNLISNALEAIPEGNPERNEVKVTVKTDARGRAEIAVSDTGTGMDAATRARIFEPFFTTKSVGLGTGLGLSIVRRLVSEAGGEISVESELGRGSVFRLSFPPASAEDALPALEPVPLKRLHRARILVIDDEPLILLAIKRLLSHEHEIQEMTNPRAALDRILHGDRFDVILCDLIMPELSGWELFAELEKRVPEQAARCVFLTGAALHVEARRFLDGVENRRIEKPFDADSLESALRAVLEDRRLS